MEPRAGIVVFFDPPGYSGQESPLQEPLGNVFMQALREAVLGLYPNTAPAPEADCPYLSAASIPSRLDRRL